MPFAPSAADLVSAVPSASSHQRRMSARLSALQNIAASYASGAGVQISGTVCEVGSNEIKISGLSEFARIGDLISVSIDGRDELAR